MKRLNQTTFLEYQLPVWQLRTMLLHVQPLTTQVTYYNKCNTYSVSWRIMGHKKIKTVQELLKAEPELITFYGSPIQTVEDHYVHIGVLQTVFKQSQAMADYRIEKGRTCLTCYKVLQKRHIWCKPNI